MATLAAATASWTCSIDLTPTISELIAGCVSVQAFVWPVDDIQIDGLGLKAFQAAVQLA